MAQRPGALRGAEHDAAAQAGVVAYGAFGTIGVPGPHGEGAVAVVVGVIVAEVGGVAPGDVAAGTAGGEGRAAGVGVSYSVHCVGGCADEGVGGWGGDVPVGDCW